MSVTPAQFKRAFTEFQLFGPRRRIPIRKRWIEVLPDVDPKEFEVLEAKCKEIEAFALKLAEKVRDKAISNTIARHQFFEKYSILNQELIEKTWSQAILFSFK